MDILALCDHTIEDGIVINFNADGWGPVAGGKINTFDDVPYTHFGKTTKIQQIADFTSIQMATAAASSSGAGGTVEVVASRYDSRAKHEKKRPAKEEISTEFTYKHNMNEDASFQLVDNARSAPTKRYGAPANKGRQQFNQTQQQQQQQPNINPRTGLPHQKGKDGKQNSGYRNQMQNRRTDVKRTERLPSVNVEGDWVVVEEFDLTQLLKLSTAVPKATDICWCGSLQAYDETYDKIGTRNAKTLKKMDKIFYSVTTTDDPIMEDLAQKGTGNVYATDAILAQLMAAPRSIYPWDIVIQKMDNLLFFDKREDNSQFDLLTVSETSSEVR